MLLHPQNPFATAYSVERWLLPIHEQLDQGFGMIGLDTISSPSQERFPCGWACISNGGDASRARVHGTTGEWIRGYLFVRYALRYQEKNRLLSIQ